MGARHVRYMTGFTNGTEHVTTKYQQAKFSLDKRVQNGNH